MSAKREKRRRRALILEYEHDLQRWRMSEPPRILFWLWIKWKKSRPVFDAKAEPRYFKKPRNYPVIKWY